MSPRPIPIEKGALIVSCQARKDNPLHGSIFMTAMAQAARDGGAKGIRAQGAGDIKAIRAVVDLPIIGLIKHFDTGLPVAITPSFADAMAIAEAGADLIALDATDRPRAGEPIDQLIPMIRAATDKAIFADIATVADGERAAALGADCVGTTLSGYTEDTARTAGPGPDFDLISALVKSVSIPVIAEGRFTTPEEVREAFRRGAHAVVVGTAITNPREITRRFAAAGGAA